MATDASDLLWTKLAAGDYLDGTAYTVTVTHDDGTVAWFERVGANSPAGAVLEAAEQVRWVASLRGVASS